MNLDTTRDESAVRADEGVIRHDSLDEVRDESTVTIDEETRQPPREDRDESTVLVDDESLESVSR